MNKIKLTIVAVAVSSLLGCSNDGTDGIDGAKGNKSLISQVQLPVGNNNCRNGGVEINSGIDTNDDGVLASDEIDSTEYVCREPIRKLSTRDIQNNSGSPWYSDAENQLAKDQQSINDIVKQAGSAKNIILFIGDGMGVSTLTASRILEGQQKGMLGEENRLSFENMPFTGFVKTYNVDAQTPDSAGTMSAIMSGVKTDAGVIGVSEAVSRGNCVSGNGHGVTTALDLAEIAGLSTGVVTTARITHATPAATYAKSAERNWEDISDMPAQAIAEGCTDIADQLVNYESNLEAKFPGFDDNGIEVVMGGGRRHFLPKDAAFNSPDAKSSIEGDRTDGRDLIAEWKDHYKTGRYVFDQAEFDAIDPATTDHLFGLFNESHMQYELDRQNDISGEPSLTQMTEKAIDILKKNPKGYFLMVESGRIDHGHHAGSAKTALTETIEFSNAVRSAMNKTDPKDTLIIVTADHSHVFTIAGYPKRGNPILGKVVSVGSDTPTLAADNMPFTTLGYTNGRGYRDLGSVTNADVSYGIDIKTDRVDLSTIDTNTNGFHQETLIPRSSETHSGEDVAIFARGPGADLVSGTNEQNIIFHIMNFAGDLLNKANEKLNQ